MRQAGRQRGKLVLILSDVYECRSHSAPSKIYGNGVGFVSECFYRLWMWTELGKSRFLDYWLDYFVCLLISLLKEVEVQSVRFNCCCKENVCFSYGTHEVSPLKYNTYFLFNRDLISNHITKFTVT